MIYVNRDSIKVPAVFSSKELLIAKKQVEAFYKGSKESRSQKKFKLAFDAELRTPILTELNNLFQGKCAYCESYIASVFPGSYDHFRPKFGARGLEKEFSDEHYWWLTYEWRNLYFSCLNCNRFKATWFPVEGKRVKPKANYKDIIQEEKPLLLDPCVDDPNEHLRFDNSGEVTFLSQRGKVTIEILHLNRKELVAERRKEIIHLELLLDSLERHPLIATGDKTSMEPFNEHLVLVLSPTSRRPYLAAQRQALSRWIDSSPARQQLLSFVMDSLDTTGVINSIDVTQISIKPELTHNQKIEIENSINLAVVKQIYLEKLILKNYKCFSDLEINFSNESKNEIQPGSQPWHLFLGENGMGKSSILRAISISLMDPPYREQVAEYIKPDRLLRKGETEGYIKLIYNSGSESTVSFSKGAQTVVSSVDSNLANVLGYGAIRVLPRRNIKPEKGKFTGMKVENLFDYSVSLSNAHVWLLKQNKKDFDRAAKALKELMLLPENSILVQSKDRGAIAIHNSIDDSITIDDLSDGYKSVYALAVDIMASLSTENIAYDLVEGIILIDEIGTHLHPRWKMEVVEMLRKTFPKLQFIVSTHEPLCLRGLRNNETIVLTRNDNHEIVALSDLPDPNELRIDQILTSEFFGLKSTFDAKTEGLFKEYYEILAKEDEDRTIEEKTRLHELDTIIPRIKHLGNDLRDEMVYHVVDELLAKQIKKDGLKINQSDLKEKVVEKVRILWDSINQSTQ